MAHWRGGINGEETGKGLNRERGGGHKTLLKRSTKFMNNYDKLNSCEFFFVSHLIYLYLYLYLCVSLKIKISHHCYSMVVYCFYLK